MDIRKQLEIAKSKRKATKRFLNSLKKEKDKVIDQLFHEEHQNSSKQIDCLSCANCCKTTGPLFTQKDIKQISNYLKIKPGDFITRYLKLDDENDYVLQQTPCSFLNQDNYCSIYEVRPKACAEFPHTDRRNQKQIFNLTVKNCEICPIVSKVVEEVQSNYLR